jgi:large subunit ribosomal protein L23
MAFLGKNKTAKKEKAEAKPRVSARALTSTHGVSHDIIRAPWFSEKALLATEKGVYTFAVPASATKAEIAGAIKEVYKVSPKKIRIVNLPGKAKQMRTRRGTGTRASRHKAYVTLNEGDTIQFA